MTEFFSKARKSTSPSAPASTSAPTPQSCPVSQGKALVMCHGQLIVVSVQITWSMRVNCTTLQNFCPCRRAKYTVQPLHD